MTFGIKYRALHDRYDRVGFLYDNLAVHYERLRKTLTAPVEADDSWVFKIVKNFFQKFVDASKCSKSQPLNNLIYSKTE